MQNFMTMKIHKVFVYGPLTKRKTQQEVFGQNLQVFSKAILTGWLMKMDQIHPYLSPCEGKKTEGCVLLMTDEQLAHYNNYKLVAEGYSRERVTVRTTDGSFFNVWAYTRRE